MEPLGADLAPATFSLGSSANTKKYAQPQHALDVFSASSASTPPLLTAQDTMAVLPYKLRTSLPLPPSYEKLLEYHTAVEQSLLVYMATHGAPSAEPTTMTPRRRIRIPHIITFQQLRPMVERTCQRTFDVPDFRRLVWLWSHAPGMPPPASDDDHAPLGGMGFLVDRIRTVDTRTHRKIYDWSVGIEMSMQAYHHRTSKQVQYGSPSNHASTPTSLRSFSPPPSPRREEMSQLAMWNTGMEERRTEMNYRLTRLVAIQHAHWLEQQGLDIACCLVTEPSTPSPAGPSHQSTAQIPVTPTKTPQGYAKGEAGLLTPSATRSGDGHATRITHDIAAISPPTSPLAPRTQPPMPSTPVSLCRARPQLVHWHTSFPLDRMPPIPPSSLPSLHVPPPTAPLSDARTKLLQRSKGPAASTSSISSMTLEERIRAKEQARSTLSATSGPHLIQQRAELSRLPAMAEAIYVLFSRTTGTHTPTGRQTRMLPMSEVLSALHASTHVALSRAEMEACLDTLIRVVPGWLAKTHVGLQDWLRLTIDPAQGLTLRDVRTRLRAVLADVKNT